MKSTIENLNPSPLAVSIGSLFTDALKDGVFSGAAAGLILNDGTRRRKETWFFGTTDKSREYEISESTFFDLASLTKPLVTVPSILVAMEKKGIDLKTPLKELLRQTIPSYMEEIQVAQLMDHSSGLPGYRPYFQQLIALADQQDRKKRIVDLILAETLLYPTGSSHVYSDLGYILLGWIIEQFAQSSLDLYWSENVLEPFGLHDKLLFKPEFVIKDPGRFAATEKCPWSGHMLRGRVHDENCRALGGVAGHAGLFGTIEGVLQFCEHIMLQYRGEEKHPAYSNENLKKILIRKKNSNWTCGFDSPSKEESSSGGYFSDQSIGHLGFTGTSFWIDLARGICIVLLTNRVHPNRANEGIKKFRPKFHDTIMASLLNQ